MNPQSGLKSIIEKLPLRVESDHFRIHYGLRNPVKGKGLGPSGVQNRGLILTYLSALEQLYRAMINLPWSRRKPVAGDDGRTNVYVFDTSELISSDGSPFMHADFEGIPYICLPSRSFEPSIQAEMHRAAAEAAHEGVHIFNYRERPLNSVHWRPWAWFDEALAVFMETHLIAGNHDHFRFLKNWIDLPEAPLDDWSARYQAGMFACYLEKRIPGFINQVWTESEQTEEPLEAMARLLPDGQKFVSCDPNVKDIFASGYCMDSYFLWDHESDNLAPELFVRFGERAITESFVVRPGQQEMSSGERLDHLACRYYRIYFKGEVQSLQVRVQSEDPAGLTSLKAELAEVTAEMRRGVIEPLRPVLAPAGTAPGSLAVELIRLDAEELDHLALVVTNCGTRAARDNTRIPHDDGKTFSVMISAR
jgi:hypothetical protein